MNLKKLTVQGLRSFKKKQELDFTRYPAGFYYVTGKNLIEPELGANGCGKSSLFDSLTWCFYNKLSTKLAAGNVANWEGAHKCETEVEIDDFLIKRTWKPNALYIDGTETSQEALEQKLGYTFSSFLYSVFISQFSTKFFDLDPALKLSIFSDIISDIASKWDVFSDSSKVKYNESDKSKTENSNNLILIESKLSTLKNQDYKTICETWDKTHTDQINQLSSILESCKGNLNKLTSEKSDLERKLIDLDDQLKNQEKELQTLQTTHNETLAKYTPLDKKANDCLLSIKIIDSSLDKFDNLGNVCPTCNMKVSESHVKKEKKKLEDSRKELENQAVVMSEQLDDLSTELDKFVDGEKRINNKINEIGLKKREHSVQLKEVDKSIKLENEAIAKTKTELEAKKAEVNPYQKNYTLQQKAIKAITRYLNVLKEEKVSLESDVEGYKYWIKGFKDIKLMVIKEALDELEININSELSRLGLSEWQIVLKIDADTKSGTVKRGFIVYVKSPYNKELVPFDCWSGGERQRLLLAGTLGLIDFINSRKRTGLDVEIYDEPSQFLSGEGIEDMIETLAQRAEETNKRIFLIDHRNFNTFGQFKSVINVLKTKEGSIIEQ